MVWKFMATACAVMVIVAAPAAALPSAELNRVHTHPVSIGPEASRFIVGFRATDTNALVQTVQTRRQAQSFTSLQANTTAADVVGVATRAQVLMARSRQITSSMHVMFLQQTLYGSAVAAALKKLRADPAVAFADVDERRYPHSIPDDPLFAASANGYGQWYMMTPSAATPSSDAAATDAVSAWTVTKGSTGTVIADVDTGIRFDHPDLARAGFGGRLLPGYDFVSGDLSSTYNLLGTFLIANDGDGWDPDPSDPGDWISAADQNNALFPAKDCAVADSSWHGTRVMGLLGAITNNGQGIAGMTWLPYLLPVRALGKCGGYDSDIIAGMQWAAGLPVSGVPLNPYPADIVNLSLGNSTTCSTAYSTVLSQLTSMGVLVVASAGNGFGPVDAPGNCPGVLAVAGLRNVGTKVGYSSLGPEVSVAAPAGNCVNLNFSDPCLKSIDTTTNSGLTVPAYNTYTDQFNSNLGTSFSAPIVSGIAALMRAVNANLTPLQLIARIKSSASAFPQPVGIPVCTAADAHAECACPNDGSECGAGMVNALAAVTSALRPIAAVLVPAAAVGSSSVLDASGSVPACGRTLASFAWTATGATIQPGTQASAQVTVTPTGTAGVITLTVTDSNGSIDTAQFTVGANGVITAATATPTTAGSVASACPLALTVTVAAPTVSEFFSPASVSTNSASTLVIVVSNSNAFALTQTSLTETLPANVTVTAATGQLAAGTSCTGALLSLTSSATTVTLSGANVPANGSCQITVPVQAAASGSYLNAIAINALSTGPAGANALPATATLTVTAPSKSGGGQLDWWDTVFAAGVLLAGRGFFRRGFPR